jgi:drug/metabolite transporter (DMT)-like permease
VAAATFFNVFSRKTSKGLAPMETTFAMMWTGAVFFGLMSLILHLAGLESVPQAVAAEAATPGLLARAWGAAPSLAYLGLLSSVGAFFLINFTLSRLRASQSAVFTNLTTLVSVLAGVLFRGEHFGLAQAFGALMIVIGVWGTNAQRGKSPA